MHSLNKYIDNKVKKVDIWATSHYLHITLYNIVLVFLFLLRSAGYFHPFFIISVNFIVLVGVVLSIFMLGARSRALFAVALVFWLFASLLRVLRIEVWAERTAVYAYQTLVIGVILLLIENVGKVKKRNV